MWPQFVELFFPPFFTLFDVNIKILHFLFELIVLPNELVVDHFLFAVESVHLSGILHARLVHLVDRHRWTEPRAFSFLLQEFLALSCDFLPLVSGLCQLVLETHTLLEPLGHFVEVLLLLVEDVPVVSQLAPQSREFRLGTLELLLVVQWVEGGDVAGTGVFGAQRRQLGAVHGSGRSRRRRLLVLDVLLASLV